MKLVICEKPGVGAAVAAALGVGEKKDGFITGNGYIVSWCIGHYSLLLVFDFIFKFIQFQKSGEQDNYRSRQNKPNGGSYLIPNLKHQNSVFRKHPA